MSNKVISLILCTMLGGVGVAGGKTDGTSRADVCLITIDTLCSDHLHCNGYQQIQTPAIDSLATQGNSFHTNL